MRLGDVIYINPDSIHSGYPYKEIEYIDISSVGTGILNYTTQIKIEDAPSRAKRIVKSGDTLLATVRPNLRSFLFIKNPSSNTIASTGFAVLRATKKIDPRFLYYTVTNQSFTDYLSANVKGAAYPAIDSETIHRADVYLPDITIQRRIASILSSYDDLIENNTRRIAILEEMARRIYEEWFVKFKFPGHEKVKMVDSELGKIPEGWKVKVLDSIIAHHIGGGWGEEFKSDTSTVPAYVIRGTDIPDVRQGSLGKSPLRFHKETNFCPRKIQDRDIIFEISGGSKGQPVGRSVLIREGNIKKADYPIICASFCRLIRADQKQILPELVQMHFERIYTNQEILKYQTQSTGITNFKFTVFINQENIIVPSHKTQNIFAEQVLPIFDLIQTLGIKNANLRTTRDFLLPKLISGEIDVSKLPEPEEAAA